MEYDCECYERADIFGNTHHFTDGNGNIICKPIVRDENKEQLDATNIGCSKFYNMTVRHVIRLRLNYSTSRATVKRNKP